MKRLYRFVFALMAASVGSAAISAGAQEMRAQPASTAAPSGTSTAAPLGTSTDAPLGMKVQEFDGAKVYRVPFYQAINVVKAELFPHHDPLKRKANWKIAYLDLGYMMTHALVEEVPAKSLEVVGQKLLAEINYIVASGEAVVVHRRPDNTESRFRVREGDIFLIPYGHWVGFANGSAESARIMGWMVSMVPAMMDQDRKLVDEEGLRAEVPFVADYIRYQQQEGPATSLGPLAANASFTERGTPPLDKKAAFTVYEPKWGTPINMGTLEAPPHHFPKRAAEGWRDAHLEMGGRAINNFIIQEEKPSLIEIGHKHGGDVFFYGLIGEGYVAMRPQEDSVEKRVFWGVGDLFALPRVDGGVWHAHANFTSERNRLIYTPPSMGTTLEDPYQLRYIKDWEKDSIGDRDKVWKAIKGPAKPPQER